MNNAELIRRLEAEVKVKNIRYLVNQSLADRLLCEIDKKKQSIPSGRECKQGRRCLEGRAKYSAPNRVGVTPDAIKKLLAYMDSHAFDTLEFHRHKGVSRIEFRMEYAKGRDADPYSAETENYMDRY